MTRCSGVDFLEVEGGCVTRTEIDIPATHLDKGGIALGTAREPVFLLPVIAHEVTERVVAARADAQAVGAGLGQRLPQVLFVGDGQLALSGKACILAFPRAPCRAPQKVLPR